MKKILLCLVALVASLSINAQIDTVRYVPQQLATSFAPQDTIFFKNLVLPSVPNLKWSDVRYHINNWNLGNAGEAVQDPTSGSWGRYIENVVQLGMNGSGLPGSRGGGYVVAEYQLGTPVRTIQDTLQYVHILDVPAPGDISGFVLENGNQKMNVAGTLFGVSGNVNKAALVAASSYDTLNIDYTAIVHMRDRTDKSKDSLIVKGNLLKYQFSLKPGKYDLAVVFANKLDTVRHILGFEVVILEGSVCDFTPYTNQINALTSRVNELQTQLNQVNSRYNRLEREFRDLQNAYDLIKDKETLIEVKISNAVPNDFIQGLTIVGDYRKIFINGVESVSACDLQILSVTGAKIYHSPINKSVVIDNLIPGIYIVKIGDLTKKVVVR